MQSTYRDLLLEALDHHDRLLLMCASGDLLFPAFLERYDNFYWSYALDGHDSDSARRKELESLTRRIAPHRMVAESVLGKIHLGGDLSTQEPLRIDRVDAIDAVNRIREITRTMLAANG
jgi:hypothetical protein